MANVKPISLNKIIQQGINEVFNKEYAKHQTGYFSGYRLEQCGKRWRVMQYILGDKTPKTDWMTYDEAEALRKLFDASTS